MKHTFTLRGKDFADIGQCEYVPLIYIAGTVTHRLALHRVPSSLPVSKQVWNVSHPTIGALVVRVDGNYKGLPCSSGGYGVKQARVAAMACLDTMLERIGSDRFNSVIAEQLDRFNKHHIELIREKIYDEHATGLDG